jgi:hypothetical protein
MNNTAVPLETDIVPPAAPVVPAAEGAAGEEEAPVRVQGAWEP